MQPSTNSDLPNARIRLAIKKMAKKWTAAQRQAAGKRARAMWVARKKAAKKK
jgi:hypothetical protein